MIANILKITLLMCLSINIFAADYDFSMQQEFFEMDGQTFYPSTTKVIQANKDQLCQIMTDNDIQTNAEIDAFLRDFIQQAIAANCFDGRQTNDLLARLKGIQEIKDCIDALQAQGGAPAGQLPLFGGLHAAPAHVVADDAQVARIRELEATAPRNLEDAEERLRTNSAIAFMQVFGLLLTEELTHNVDAQAFIRRCYGQLGGGAGVFHNIEEQRDAVFSHLFQLILDEHRHLVDPRLRERLIEGPLAQATIVNVQLSPDTIATMVRYRLPRVRDILIAQGLETTPDCLTLQAISEAHVPGGAAAAVDFECAYCAEEKTADDALKFENCRCAHQICRTCAHDELEAKDQAPYECATCHNVMTIRDLRALGLDEAAIERYKVRVLEHHLGQQAGWKFCPAGRECSQGMIASTADATQFERFACTQCDFDSCIHCKRHHEGPCLVDDADAIQVLLRDARRDARGSIRPCYYCGLMTERRDGCSSMICATYNGGCGRRWHFNWGSHPIAGHQLGAHAFAFGDGTHHDFTADKMHYEPLQAAVLAPSPAQVAIARDLQDPAVAIELERFRRAREDAE